MFELKHGFYACYKLEFIYGLAYEIISSGVDTVFENEVRDLITQWNVDDVSPPVDLSRDQWSRSVGRNWRIDMLVTWMALNSYRAYDQDFLGSRNDYTFREDVMKDLTKKAMAICAIVLNNV